MIKRKSDICHYLFEKDRFNKRLRGKETSRHLRIEEHCGGDNSQANSEGSWRTFQTNGAAVSGFTKILAAPIVIDSILNRHNCSRVGDNLNAERRRFTCISEKWLYKQTIITRLEYMLFLSGTVVTNS